MKTIVDNQLDHEIILTVTKSAGELIGKYSVEKILNKMADSDGVLEGRALIFSFGNEIQSSHGNKGAFATMRQMGREVAKVLMSKHKVFEWEGLFEKGLSTLGFAQWVEKDKEKACLFGCTYCDVLKQKGLQPLEHSICWFGWGFTEGFLRMLEKDLFTIEWSGCDPENKKCCFKLS